MLDSSPGSQMFRGSRLYDDKLSVALNLVVLFVGFITYTLLRRVLCILEIKNPALLGHSALFVMTLVQVK